MKKHILLSFILISLSILGCKKNSVEPETTTTSTVVYGTVFNAVNHEPVNGATTEIGACKLIYGTSYYCTISSSVSGYDGRFEMRFEQADNIMYFYVRARCDGYDNYQSIADFSVNGNCYNFDILLYPDDKTHTTN